MFEKRQISIKNILNLKSRGWKTALRSAVIILFAVILPLWLWFYLRPDTWHYYTDEVEFSRIKRYAEPQLVVWNDACPITGAVNNVSNMAEPVISPDGSMMAFTRNSTNGNADIFFSKWDGKEWEHPAPARALNSRFNEKSPAFSRDRQLLFFSTDRPGGPGGFDIWVSRWDGAEYAWPVPLTIMVNSPYDDTGPCPSASGRKLYFSSNRPRQKDEKKHEDEETTTSYIIEGKITEPAEDFDIFSANIIPSGVTNREVERAISMLYYLREAALSDETIMKELGGSQRSEKAIDRALEYLKDRQEDDGSWRINRANKGGKHDVACTSLALLTYFGRGHRHDRPGPYQETVSNGLDWLIKQQKTLGEIYGRGDFYDQAIATLALGEAYGLTKDEKIFDAAHTAIDYIVECQNKDGGWRYTKGQSPSDLSVSGWMIMALKNAQLSGLYVPEETFAGIRDWLKQVGGGKHGGLFGYQGGNDNREAMKVTGYFCSQLMGLSPNTMKSFEAAEIMLNKGPFANDFYYLYYGTLAANQHQGPLWKSWQKTLPEIMIPLQQQDGSWNQAQGNHSAEMRDVVGTALITLSLQAHYRYTPMFGLGYEPDSEKKNLSVKSRDELAEVPLYRRAKRQYRLSSPEDDTHPALTEHGDFIYFASDRAGGCGGFDIYRSRISGEKPTKPENLGAAVNSSSDETAPTTRAAGFELMFCSNREQGNPGNHLIYSSVSKRVQIKTDSLRIAPLFWFIRTFIWHIVTVIIAILFFVYWLTKLRIRQAAKAPRGPPPTLSLKFVRLARKWILPAVCVFTILLASLSVYSTMKNTVWCFYTDGKDINRSAMTENARPVLWNTHITLGELNRPRPVINPVFSPDETELCFSYISAKTKKPVYYTSRWDGTSWSKAQKLRAEEPDEPELESEQETGNINQADEAKNEQPIENENTEKKEADIPVELARFSQSSAVSGGYFFLASDELKGKGGYDIFYAPVDDRDNAVNLGPFVNSEDDDMAPAARMEGFDIIFVSDRGQKDENKYVLFTSTAREVTEHIDYTRWHNLMSLFDRLKWWIFALIAAATGLIYLLKHWKNIDSLFHRCLLGSLAVHLLLLFIMAFWMISAEFVESVETTAMEISLDVNALAQEKLALELEQDVTEMEDLVDAPALERQQQETPAIPLLPPEATEETPVVKVETTRESLVDQIKPVEFITPETETPEMKKLDPLPELEMPEIEITLEMEEAPEKEKPEEKQEEKEPAIRQEQIEITKLQIEQPIPETEPTVTETPELTQPEVNITPVDIPVSEKTPREVEPEEIAIAKPELAQLETTPDVIIPKPELEAKQAEKTQETDEYKPETAQEKIETEKAEHDQPATDALSDLAETSELTISNIVAAVSIEELMTKTAGSLAKTDIPEETVQEQILEVPEVAIQEPELDVKKTATSSTEQFEAASAQADVDLQKAEYARPEIETGRKITETSQLDIKAALDAKHPTDVMTQAAVSAPAGRSPDKEIPDQIIEALEVAVTEAELEVRKTATSSTEQFEAASAQADVDLQKTEYARPEIKTGRKITETSQLDIKTALDAKHPTDVMTQAAVSAPAGRNPDKEIPDQITEALELAVTEAELEVVTSTITTSTGKFANEVSQDVSVIARMNIEQAQSSVQASLVIASDILPALTVPPAERVPVQTRITSAESTTDVMLKDIRNLTHVLPEIEITDVQLAMEMPDVTTKAKSSGKFTPAVSRTSSQISMESTTLPVSRTVTAQAVKTEVQPASEPQTLRKQRIMDAETIRTTFSSAVTVSTEISDAPRVQQNITSIDIELEDVEMTMPAAAETSVAKTAVFSPAGVQSRILTPKQVSELPPSNGKVPVRFLPDFLADKPGEPVLNSVSIETKPPPALPPVPVSGNAEFASVPISTQETGPELQIDLPGKLDIPPGAAAKVIPEIMKNPSKLSDEIIESLGGSADTQGSIVESLNWFTKNQEKDGRWSLGKHGGNSAHDVGGTSLVLLCYYGWGAKHNQAGEHQETVKRALNWLKSRMQKDGDLRGWIIHRYEDNQLLGNMYDHSIATIALCEAYSLTRDRELLDPASRAVEFLLKAQNSEMGGWRYDPNEESDTSSLGWAYMALKSAEMAGIEVPGDALEKADAWLNKVSGGKSGGIYGYQKFEDKRPAMVATGMFCRQLAGVPNTDPRMYEGVSYIATHPLDAKEVDFYYMYYGTLVLYQQQGEAWEKWNARMKAILLSKQHKAGNKAGSWDPAMWYEFQMGRVGATAIATLSLEVYYRLLPLYGFEQEK